MQVVGYHTSTICISTHSSVSVTIRLSPVRVLRWNASEPPIAHDRTCTTWQYVHRVRNSQRRQYMYHRWYPMQLRLLAGSQTHDTQHESSMGRRRSSVITHLPGGIAHPRLSRPLPLALWDNAQAYTRHQRDGTRDRNHAHNRYDHRRYHRHTSTRRASHTTSYSISLAHRRHTLIHSSRTYIYSEFNPTRVVKDRQSSVDNSIDHRTSRRMHDHTT